MTDEEILKAADAIRDKRNRAKIGREFMNCETVQLVAFDKNKEIKRITVPKDANLAAVLCRLLDCNISEE